MDEIFLFKLNCDEYYLDMSSRWKFDESNLYGNITRRCVGTGIIDEFSSYRVPYSLVNEVWNAIAKYEHSKEFDSKVERLLNE